MDNLLGWLTENEPLFRKSRLPSLYSDLSVQKTTNPEGYAANVTAWQSALTTAALAGKLPSQQKVILDASQELVEDLASPQYGKPSGLGLVLDESVRSGKMLDLKDFINAESSIYHHSWIPTPWAVLRWGLRQTGLVGASSYNVSGQLRKGELILVSALEEVTKQILAAQAGRSHSLTDRILTRDDFRKVIDSACKTSFTTKEEDVLLKYLSRDKGLLVYDIQTVKFKATSVASPEPITKEDATIAALKSLTSSIESQISDLEQRLEVLQSKAKAAVQSKNRQVALSALKSKKMTERTLQQRTDTLHQLEDVLTKIEDAVDQIQIVEVMQASAGVLRDLNKRIGGVERVEDVVENLREQMAKVDEVGQVLQEPLDPSAVVDESEVDEELDAMERMEREAQEKQEAESTRKRLEELEGADRQKLADEKKLQSSIEQLERMDITSGSNTAARIPEHNVG